jgi:hypothetical protein
VRVVTSEHAQWDLSCLPGGTAGLAGRPMHCRQCDPLSWHRWTTGRLRQTRRCWSGCWRWTTWMLCTQTARACLDPVPGRELTRLQRPSLQRGLASFVCWPPLAPCCESGLITMFCQHGAPHSKIIRVWAQLSGKRVTVTQQHRSDVACTCGTFCSINTHNIDSRAWLIREAAAEGKGTWAHRLCDARAVEALSHERCFQLHCGCKPRHGQQAAKSFARAPLPEDRRHSAGMGERALSH